MPGNERWRLCLWRERNDGRIETGPGQNPQANAVRALDNVNLDIIVAGSQAYLS